MSEKNWAPFLAFEGIEGSKDKNGIESVNVSYFVPTLAMARTYIPEAVLALIGLPVVRRGFKQEWGNGPLIEMGRDGAYKLMLSCEGVQNPQDGENGVQFDSDATLADERIAAHPDLPALMDKYDGTEDDSGHIVWQPQIESPKNSGNYIKNPIYGWDKWRVPGIVWTKTYHTVAPSSSVTYMLGKIDNPPSAPDGALPWLPEKRNWLKIIGKQTWKGNVWKVTEAWQMSAPGGWTPELYR